MYLELFNWPTRGQIFFFLTSLNFFSHIKKKEKQQNENLPPFLKSLALPFPSVRRIIVINNSCESPAALHVNLYN